MNTDVDLENELLQLVVEELVRAGLRSPLREPILRAVETTPEDHVEVVVPEGTAGTADTEALPEASGGADSAGDGGEAVEDADADAAEGGGGGKTVRKLVVLGLLATVIYVTFRRLSGDDGA